MTAAWWCSEQKSAKKAAVTALRESKQAELAELKRAKKNGKQGNDKIDQKETSFDRPKDDEMGLVGMPVLLAMALQEPEPDPELSERYAESERQKRVDDQRRELQSLASASSYADHIRAAEDARRVYEASALDRGIITQSDVMARKRTDDRELAKRARASAKADRKRRMGTNTQYDESNAERAIPKADHGVGDELHNMALEQAERNRLSREAQEKYEAARREAGHLTPVEQMEQMAAEQFVLLKLQVAWKGWVEKRPDEKVSKDGTERVRSTKYKYQKRYFGCM
jgi:hypothetical protein